jgi:hypothetical protein
MTTSGTVSRTVVDVVTVLEKAAKKCGALPTVFSAESLDDAKLNLFLILAGLVNRGVNLWSTKKAVYPTESYRANYTLMEGTEDLTHVMLRRAAVADLQTTLVDDTATYLPSSATKVTSVIITPTATGDYIFVLESSADGVDWVNNGSFSGTVNTVGERLSFDSDPSPTRSFWRVRELTFTPPSGGSSGELSLDFSNPDNSMYLALLEDI